MIKKLFGQGAIFLHLSMRPTDIPDILNSVPKLVNAMKKEDFFPCVLVSVCVTSHILRYELIKIHTGNEIVINREVDCQEGLHRCKCES